MIAAVASVLYDEAVVGLDFPDGEEVQPQHKFIMQFIKVLSSANREATVHISMPSWISSFQIQSIERTTCTSCLQ